MAFIEIRTQEAAAELETRLKTLYGKDAAKAVNRAINHTLGKANTEANRQIRSVYKIALADLNDKDNKLIKNSSEYSLTGTINASIRPLSLSKFNPVWVRNNARGVTASKMKSFLVRSTKNKSNKTSRGNQGVTVEVVKGKKETINSAFLIFKGSGSPVMARGQYSGSSGFLFGRPRLPINKLNTKSIYYSLINEDVQKGLAEKVNVDYPERLLHELNKGLQFNNPI